MRTIATAGHVDHGKSSLVLALTGTDPDRFPEEKARGLTIDLGFAFATLPSGTEIAFVDVPGHVRFIKNMLAGVGAVDLALLVVAATEGWMPQTEEHLRILELLGVAHGMVAITKADLVDDETVELAELEVTEHLEGTALEHAPIVELSEEVGRLDVRFDALADEPEGDEGHRIERHVCLLEHERQRPCLGSESVLDLRKRVRDCDLVLLTIPHRVDREQLIVDGHRS